MGRPALDSKQVDEFRRAIVDASMRLFVQHGYDGWSLRALAKELDCSHATPYRYFEGKAAIFAAVRIEGFRRFAAFLRKSVGTHVEVSERLHALAWGYFGFAEQQTPAFRVIFGMGQPEIDSFDGVREAAADAWSVVLAVVAEAIDAGLIAGDVDEVAHTMWASVHGVVTLHLSHKLAMGRTADKILPTVIQALIRAHQPGAKSEEDQHG